MIHTSGCQNGHTNGSQNEHISLRCRTALNNSTNRLLMHSETASAPSGVSVSAVSSWVAESMLIQFQDQVGPRRPPRRPLPGPLAARSATLLLMCQPASGCSRGRCQPPGSDFPLMSESESATAAGRALQVAMPVC